MNNTITLIGHVGQQPIAKTFQDTGNKVVKFSLAVKDYSSNSDNAKTMWVDVDAWNALADRALKIITKGREIVIHGRLALSTFSKDVNGTKVQMTKPVVKLTNFYLCGSVPRRQQEVNNDEQLTQTS